MRPFNGNSFNNDDNNRSNFSAKRGGISDISTFLEPSMLAAINARGGGGGATGDGGSGGSADGGAVGPGGVLRVTFANRTSANGRGRRRLHNLIELLELCNRWQPSAVDGNGASSSGGASGSGGSGGGGGVSGSGGGSGGGGGGGDAPAVRVQCRSHNFGVGLVKSLPTLRTTDVLVTSHGADMINAFAMRKHATVFEVMPVYQAGCPCKMYKELLSNEGGAGPVILHYQLASRHGQSGRLGGAMAGHHGLLGLHPKA